MDFKIILVISLFSMTRAADVRIVNGEDAIKDQFPYLVSLKSRERDFQHSCGGTLISMSYILTAAHCVHSGKSESNPRGKLMRPKDIRVVAGEYSLKKDDPMEQKQLVTQITVHKDYIVNKYEMLNDLALLKLAKPMIFSKQIVETIPVGSPDLESLGLGEVSGWGIQSVEGDSKLSDTPQYTFLRILLPEDCWDNSGLLICTTGDHKNNVCYGDNGGPMVCSDYTHGKFFLCGVTSYVNPANCTGDYKAAFTKVSEFNKWIDTNTDGDVIFLK